jgi:hypothetical protein
MWAYAPSVPEQTRQRLCAMSNYELIVQAICRSAMRGGVSYREESGKQMVGRSRPKFLIEVDASLGDPFFSGPVGYRAAYAHDLQEGKKANRQILDELMLVPTLRQQSSRTPTWIEQSLKHSSAKVWIFQRGSQYWHDPSPSPPEIIVPNWMASWNQAVAIGGECRRSREERPRCCKAIRGVRLHGPVTKLEVIGAWMTADGQPVDPPANKLPRSEDIWLTGFA